MRKIPSLILFALLSLAIHAQKADGIVKGKITDTASKQPVANATISAMLLKDSSLAAFSISDSKGNFEIRNLEAGEYNLLISSQGFQYYKQAFIITTDKKINDIGSVILLKDFKTLEGVVVRDESPVKIKEDTVEFKADGFKTRPNATVEDLLKKLPGVEVSKDGTVKAQGEQVQKVYVDGKEFFGTDPKLATKNLTADMVESIQVYDDMSEQARFTKIDDGSKTKAVNIKLKKDKKNGYFGKSTVGAGTDGRYDANLSFNRFNGDRQVSFIGAANNINKQGFSFSDVVSMMGGFGAMGGGSGGGGFGGGGGGMQMLGGTRTGGGSGGGGAMSAFGLGSSGSGIAKSLSAGLNYRDVWGPKISTTGSVFVSQTDNELRQDRLRQTLFPDDSTAIQNITEQRDSRNQNLRFNYRIEYKIDSLNSILYTPSVTLQHSETVNEDTSFIQSINGLSQSYLALTSKNRNTNERDGYNINNNILYRRKLNKTGRTFTLGWTNAVNNSDGEGFSLAPFTSYKSTGDVLFVRDQNLQNKQKTRGHNNVISTSYTEPVGKNKLVEINYAFTSNQNTSDRKAFNFNTSSGKYDLENAQQTNLFENGFTSHRAGANFRIQEKKYNYQFGLAAQFAELSSHSIRKFPVLKDTTIKQNFVNLFPSANFNYTFSRTKNLRINYRGRTNAPSVNQLQDVLDVSNPLQVSTGNPALKQEFTNNLNVNFNTFNFLTFKYYAVGVIVNQTSNKIVNSIDSISRTVQLTKPVNLNGAYNATAFYSMGIPIKNKKLKGSNVNLTTTLSSIRGVSLVYKAKNITNTFLLSQTAGTNIALKEKFDLGINATVLYNKVNYSLQSNLNTDYFTQTYSVDAAYTFKNNIVLSSDFDYFINTGRGEGFNQSIPMWNGSVAKQFAKKKNIELKLSVFDILNQNQSINRTTGDNFIEDTRSNVLRRYFLLSLMFNLNKGGSKNQQPGMPPMPRQIQRGMRDMRISG